MGRRARITTEDEVMQYYYGGLAVQDIYFLCNNSKFNMMTIARIICRRERYGIREEDGSYSVIIPSIMNLKVRLR